MKQNLWAVVGVSGVGKSFLLNSLQNHVQFTRMSASDVIHAGKAYSERNGDSRDYLRELDIDDNQEYLIRGIDETYGKTEGLLILDGHIVIDTPNGFVDIDWSVFDAIGVRRIIHIVDHPEKIIEKRMRDTSRRRPSRDIDQVTLYQETSLLAAARISTQLRIPLTVIVPEDEGELLNILRSYP